MGIFLPCDGFGIVLSKIPFLNIAEICLVSIPFGIFMVFFKQSNSVTTSPLETQNVLVSFAFMAR